MSLIPLGILAASGGGVSVWALQNAPNTAVLDWWTVAYKPLTNANWYLRQRSASSINTYYYSTNGTSWTSGTLPSASPRWKLFVPGSDRVLAIRGFSSTGAVAYSTNGTTWTSANFPIAGDEIYQGIWDGTRFLIVGARPSGEIGCYYSTDGTTWGSFNIDNGNYSIAFDGVSRYVAMQAGTSSTHNTCTSDPTVEANWTAITLPSNNQWPSVVYGNGIWVAFRYASSSYATSTNGTTWTSRTLPAPFPGDTDVKGYFANGNFYYVSSTNEALYTSTNGTSWTLVTNNTLDIARSWAYGDGKIIAAGLSLTTGQQLLGTNV